MDRYFSKIAFRSINRTLNLLDRNAYAKTFGCFDKYYWHFKTKDFPSSSYQMGVEFLARLWNDSHKENTFYKNPQLLNWIKAVIRYTCSIQHKDGSFDEWYPNERGWAGPTAYILHALVNAYQISEKELDIELKNQVQNCFLKAGDFLMKQKEGAKLANHYALFLLSLYEISEVTSSHLIKSKFDNYINAFESFVSEEGWSIEYDNVDFGYNLATLSFLARLDKLYPHPFFKKYAESSFDFLSYFFYPDGSFGGLGSRETIHLYPFALKYWSQSLPIARQIYNHLQNKKAFEELTPSDQDDHYLFYRLSEYLEADNIKNTLQTEQPGLLPFASKKTFKKYFSKSGLFIKKSDDFYFVSNMKKGGALRIYDIKTEKRVLKNNGWIIKSKTKLLTSFWHSKNNEIKIEDHSISIKGKSAVLTQKYFNSWKLILFRITNILAIHHKIAFFLKKIVRRFLITQKRRSGFFYERLIQFEKEKIIIEDHINCKKPEKIFYGGSFSIRYVPQSNYFEQSDIQNMTFIFKPNLQKNKIIIKQVCDLRSTKIDPFLI